MCGEKMVLRSMLVIGSGSPPHVRGKEVSGGEPMSYKRITPACAGKSYQRSKGAAEHQDHPRMCGEKSKKIP